MSRFQTPVLNVSSLLVKSPSSRYVAACAKSTSGLPLYDLIVMDVFDGEGETPEAFLTEDFGTLGAMDVSWDFAWDFTINVLDVTMEYRILLKHVHTKSLTAAPKSCRVLVIGVSHRKYDSTNIYLF